MQVFIHQLNMTDDDHAELKRHGWAAATWNRRIEIRADQNPTLADLEDFQVVARVHNTGTQDSMIGLEDVFHVGNGYPVDGIAIQKFHQMHSVSVGDIVEVDTGVLPNKFHLVAGCGFEELSPISGAMIDGVPAELADPFNESGWKEEQA